MITSLVSRALLIQDNNKQGTVWGFQQKAGPRENKLEVLRSSWEDLLKKTETCSQGSALTYLHRVRAHGMCRHKGQEMHMGFYCRRLILKNTFLYFVGNDKGLLSSWGDKAEGLTINPLASLELTEICLLLSWAQGSKVCTTTPSRHVNSRSCEPCELFHSCKKTIKHIGWLFDVGFSPPRQGFSV